MLFLARNYELVRDRERTFLTSAVSAGATTLTVKAVDSNAWADNDWIIVGEIGSNNAEILQINGAVSDGTSLTVDAGGSGSSRFAHAVNEPVYRIDYNQIEFSRAATETGSKAVLATNEIQPDDEYTRYEDTTNTTGYGFVRFKNSTTNAFSAYSDAIEYTGYAPRSLGRIAGLVRRRLNLKDADQDFIADDDIREEANEKQRDIAHERLWPFYETVRSASTVAYQRDYEIDDDVVMGKAHTVTWDGNPLARISQTRFDMLHWDTNVTGDPTHFLVWDNTIKLYPLKTSAATSTTLGAAISSATATSVTLTSVSGFKAPGRFLVDSEVISYEYIDSSNNILYGCQRGLEGTTAATHSNGAAVTYRDIIYTAHEEPAELIDITDETHIPDPDVLVNGTAMELAIGKLQDQVLHDRLKLKYQEGLDGLRNKFGKKATAHSYVIRDKDDYVRDAGSFRDPNLFPQNFSGTV